MKTCLIAIHLILFSSVLFGQVDPESRIESMRIAFITNKLSLTPEESQQFWPVYNEYKSKEKALRDKYRGDKDIDSMSDKEVEDLVMRSFELQQKELDLKKDYFQKLRNVISLRKLAKLQRAETMFREEMLKRIKEGGPGPGGQGQQRRLMRPN